MTMATKSDNRREKALRLIDAGRVLPMPPTQRITWGVEGEHGVYLVALLPPGAAKPVRERGRPAPAWSCTCEAGLRRELCSHVLAAGTLREQERQELGDEFADVLGAA